MAGKCNGTKYWRVRAESDVARANFQRLCGATGGGAGTGRGCPVMHQHPFPCGFSVYPIPGTRTVSDTSTADIEGLRGAVGRRRVEYSVVPDHTWCQPPILVAYKTTPTTTWAYASPFGIHRYPCVWLATITLNLVRRNFNQ